MAVYFNPPVQMVAVRNAYVYSRPTKDKKYLVKTLAKGSKFKLYYQDGSMGAIGSHEFMEMYDMTQATNPVSKAPTTPTVSTPPTQTGTDTGYMNTGGLKSGGIDYIVAAVSGLFFLMIIEGAIKKKKKR